MSDLELRMIMLSTDHLEASIAFYVETLGMKLKFRDGDRFAAIDAGPITLALATADDHPVPGSGVGDQGWRCGRDGGHDIGRRWFDGRRRCGRRA